MTALCVQDLDRYRWESGFSVIQCEKFSFLVFTGNEDTRVKHLRVSIILRNHCWDEIGNRRMANNASDPNNQLCSTSVQGVVTTVGGEPLLEWSNHVETPGGFLAMVVESDFMYRRSDGPASPYVDLALESACTSFRNMADFGRIAYPSYEYMMQKLPSHFRPYFADFDWNVQYPDRQPKFLFSYRPAKSVREWRARLDQATQWNVSELPWYQDGYWNDDHDSYEYYWDEHDWIEEATSSLLWTCWRRVEGSSERGQLCIVQRHRYSNEFFNVAVLRFHPPGLPLPVPSSRALFIDERDGMV